jgi:acyl-coenzyme A synthetase/AMP-(fatty) acid ligase
VSESEIVTWCRDRLADFKRPKTVHVVEAIPRTATGKVQRLSVAAWLAGGKE